MCTHTRATIIYRVCLAFSGSHMFSLRLRFLLSCLCSKVRGELGPIVARLPGMEAVGAEGEERV